MLRSFDIKYINPTSGIEPALDIYISNPNVKTIIS